MVKSFDDMLNFIFTPLFEATNDPVSHPDLARFLCHVSGFDSVDDESKHEFVHFDRSTPAPPDYKDQENPPYRCPILRYRYVIHPLQLLPLLSLCQYLCLECLPSNERTEHLRPETSLW